MTNESEKQSKMSLAARKAWETRRKKYGKKASATPKQKRENCQFSGSYAEAVAGDSARTQPSGLGRTQIPRPLAKSLNSFIPERIIRII